ncbi:ClpXP protease specificity-enhancing factor SspB [Polyangium mundeleinium]|uniref:ClpXP protease specificity-enhancing factor SspB n=1 Tax=Polyangium mundeleinium TaxID=2995306 RepID=A0ABT5F5T7_9BACT|nr:ClpXP protease specificity-enhancing factor SspB [Polyangium mundeleinium]MDC0749466.1 ClpXP protease specificity-enhancing factor SspB [Polyangium mundeleinium]
MSDGHQKLPPKKEVALALLEGPSMYVHLDPRRSGVLVPKRFLEKSQLVLQIGLNMFIPIPDLKVDDEGISCTLSFDRAPFSCFMPWNAIYALVGEDGRGMMWPTDIPPEVVAQMQAPQQQAKDAQKPVQKKPRPRLAAVGDAPPEPEDKPLAEDPAPAQAAPPEEAAAKEGASGEAAAAAESSTEEPKTVEATESPRPQAAPALGPGRKPRRELPPYLRVVK